MSVKDRQPDGVEVYLGRKRSAFLEKQSRANNRQYIIIIIKLQLPWSYRQAHTYNGSSSAIFIREVTYIFTESAMLVWAKAKDV